ncbi:MAG: hypothetical protein H0T76_14600 [Nannocystis sp.]|nr:hypothetical protein [Nannocystis sp.]MBA3547712.1 hypothetical protein [Nannocystis sp.]
MSARLALASLLGAAQVPEPPAPAAVQWTAPPECPDAAFVRTTISRRLGRPLAEGEATLVAHVVRTGARGYVLHLQLSVGARNETRDIADPSCVSLAEVAALRIVAAVEQQTPVSPAEAPPAEAPPAEAPPAEAPPADTSPPQIPAPAPETPSALAPVRPPISADVPQNRPRTTGGFLRLHGGGELGAVPGPTGAVGLAGGLLGPRWRAELRGTFVAPRTAVRALGELQAGLFAGSMHGCGRLGRGALEVPLCVGLELGAMQGDPRVPSGRPVFAVWMAAALGPGLVWHAGRRWGLGMGFELALALVRPRFELGEGARTEPLFRPSVASGRLWFGIELRFGDPW